MDAEKDDQTRLRRYKLKAEDIQTQKAESQRAYFLHSQRCRIREWKPKSDVWSLLYGSTILAGAAGLTGAYIMSSYRRSFRIFGHNMITTYVPMTLGPALVSYVFHEMMIVPAIMIPGAISCPSCVATRSGIVQSLCGAVWPLLMTPPLCMTMALKYYTIPIDRSGPIIKTTLSMLKKTSPKSGILLAAIIGNFFVGMGIAGKEGQAYEKFLYSVEKDQIQDETFS